MKPHSLLCVIASIVVSTACGDNAGSNAPTLWLALDGRETEVRLVEQEPEPF